MLDFKQTNNSMKTYKILLICLQIVISIFNIGQAKSVEEASFSMPKSLLEIKVENRLINIPLKAWKKQVP